MSDTTIAWQDAVKVERDDAASQMIIDTINELLRDDPAMVIKEVVSELTLTLRTVRNAVLRIDYDCDADTKSQVLFKANNMTVETFSKQLLDQIAESRQLTDLLSFYAMALAESQKKPNA